MLPPTYTYSDSDTKIDVTWLAPSSLSVVNHTGYKIEWLSSDNVNYVDGVSLCDAQAKYDAATTATTWTCTGVSIASLKTLTGQPSNTIIKTRTVLLVNAYSSVSSVSAETEIYATIPMVEIDNSTTSATT